MDCPKCGWSMKPVDSETHETLKDTLYRCTCGTTHLVIDSLTLDPDDELKQLLKDTC